MSRIAVIGAGSWGTALAVHFARAGRPVHLWARDERLVARMIASGANDRYLPDVPLPPAVVPTSSLGDALEGTQFVVVAVPSHGLRTVIRTAAPLIPRDAVVVSAAKGLEGESLRRMSEVIEEETGGELPVVVLSGPSFAVEVARGLPTALLAASSDSRAAARVQEQFRGRGLRLYASDDVAGVEIGGALKNVIAIAAGVVEGLGLGQNALAALITRGLAEITRLARREGAQMETLMGLAGLGDLVLTCTGNLSRNRFVGEELGKGRTLAEITAALSEVAEGINTARAVKKLADRAGLEMPITNEVNAVLYDGKPARDAVFELMSRPLREENPR